MQPETAHDILYDVQALSFPPTYPIVRDKLQKWVHRFPQFLDNSIFHELLFLYLTAPQKYLNHRHPSHLIRLLVATHLMHKNLQNKATFYSHQRHLHVRWFPTKLHFPFSTVPVLGCLIGFNLLDGYELFDEENILFALQKHCPQIQLVKESLYLHPSQDKNLKFIYFEIEKKDGTNFSLQERALLRKNISDKIKNSIQKLSPSVPVENNEESIYKSILVLSQEIQSTQDLPQASIHLDQQTGKEIVFCVTLVYVAPFLGFSLKNYFSQGNFISERVFPVKQLADRTIEAHIFHLHLERDSSILRPDGSLNFYVARQKIVDLIKTSIGEFQDHNGGVLVKQQELLYSFKENYPEITHQNPALIERFFHALLPLEKQAVLPLKLLCHLFNYYQTSLSEKLPKGISHSFTIYQNESKVFLISHSKDNSFLQIINTFLNEQAFMLPDLAYNLIENEKGVFFNCVLLKSSLQEAEPLIQNLQQSLTQWQQKIKSRQTLRIALENSIVSLDPRVGGDSMSTSILKLLFEGLTRFHQTGNVENALAESIEISPDSKQYTFKIARTTWNDGSRVTAYDFEYAWKKILSPSFKTSFAYLFDPIKNAKEAKEGKVSPDQIGIHVLDERTLVVELIHPTPYFLQLVALPIYSPVHRITDQLHPQWPYQSEKNYPCNGPFQLKINQSSQGFELIKNPHYWDSSRITLDHIILSEMNHNQAIRAFENGEIDWIGNPFGSWDEITISRINKTKTENRVVSFPNNFVCWLVFNTQNTPFHHIKIRQAIAYAIQRTEMTKDFPLSTTPAYSPIPFNKSQQKRIQYPEHDKQKARQLFDEALEELKIQRCDLAPFKLLFHEKGLQPNIAKFFKRQIEECLGIECQLDSQPWSTAFKKLSAGHFQLSFILWTSWVDDPIYTFNAFKNQEQAINFSNWENTEYKQRLDSSNEEINPFLRSRHLLEAEKILCYQMPVIPLFYQNFSAVVKKDLQVMFQNPCSPFDIARSYYKKGD